MSNELFLSILAMDSYNRGYDPGLALSSAATGIGTATIATDSTIKLGLPATSAAGFYAISYSWNNQTVISYRGTDNADFFTLGNGASDFWNGWVTAAGVVVPGGQADLAIRFYNSATGGDVLSGISGGAILTGHSLGGGLAAGENFVENFVEMRAA